MSQPEIESLSHQIDPESLAVLPRTSGVYIFNGEGTLPLYIGKSVDIRSRVLAHLRAEDEAEMIAQSRRVDFVETAGEIGALLLEARLIKQQSPLFNIRLRRLRNLCAIRLVDKSDGKIPEVVTGKDVPVGETDEATDSRSFFQHLYPELEPCSLSGSEAGFDFVPVDIESLRVLFIGWAQVQRSVLRENDSRS